VPPYWAFPKGHAEPADASPLATAFREVAEETGLHLSKDHIVSTSHSSIKHTHPSPEHSKNAENTESPAKSFVQRYVNPRKGWVKEVRYWIALVDAETARREVVVQEMEVAEARWCSWLEAGRLLSAGRGGELLREVGAWLDGGVEGDEMDSGQIIEE